MATKEIKIVRCRRKCNINRTRYAGRKILLLYLSFNLVTSNHRNSSIDTPKNISGNSCDVKHRWLSKSKSHFRNLYKRSVCQAVYTIFPPRRQFGYSTAPYHFILPVLFSENPKRKIIHCFFWHNPFWWHLIKCDPTKLT